MADRLPDPGIPAGANAPNTLTASYTNRLADVANGLSNEVQENLLETDADTQIQMKQMYEQAGAIPSYNK
jgi:hypothetical protein